MTWDSTCCVRSIPKAQREKTINAKVSGCGELEKNPMTFDFLLLLFKVMLFLCGVLKWRRIITSEHFLANGLFYPNISAGASVLLLFLKEPCCSCTLLYNCIILSRQMQYYSVQYKRIERGAITLELQSSCYASYLSAGYSVLGFVPCHSGDS